MKAMQTGVETSSDAAINSGHCGRGLADERVDQTGWQRLLLRAGESQGEHEVVPAADEREQPGGH